MAMVIVLAVLIRLLMDQDEPDSQARFHSDKIEGYPLAKAHDQSIITFAMTLHQVGQTRLKSANLAPRQPNLHQVSQTYIKSTEPASCQLPNRTVKDTVIFQEGYITFLRSPSVCL